MSKMEMLTILDTDDPIMINFDKIKFASDVYGHYKDGSLASVKSTLNKIEFEDWFRRIDKDGDLQLSAIGTALYLDVDIYINVKESIDEVLKLWKNTQ